MKITHHVEFYYPGSFFAESETKKISHRNPLRVGVPPGAFAFILFDLEHRTGVLEDGEKITNTKRVRESGRFYPGAEVYTPDQIAALPAEFDILKSIVRGNGWKRMVKTRCGNWQPLEERDTVLPARPKPRRKAVRR